MFVFDGSSDPFLDHESLGFFQHVFEDCTTHGKSINEWFQNWYIFLL